MPPPFAAENKLPHVETSPRRVRVHLGGKIIVDTRNAQYVWEHAYYPVYYFHAADVPSEFLRDGSGGASTGTGHGQGQEQVLGVGHGSSWAAGAARRFGQDGGALAGLVKLDFGKMDAWYEEDERQYGHPKDPYKRVDVLQSSRAVRVAAGGVELARTDKPRLLFETGLRTRTYIAPTDVRMELLVPSSTTSVCPYKGVANYYDIKLPNGETLKDHVWWYRTAQPECAAISGFLCFYEEKPGLSVSVDGEAVGGAK